MLLITRINILAIFLTILSGWGWAGDYSIESCGKTISDSSVGVRLLPCVTYFSSGFEEPLELGIEGWHQFQLQGSDLNPGSPQNKVERTSDRVHGGATSLKTYTPASEVLQKASIARELLFFPPYSHLWFSGWFYIVGGESHENLSILDFESTRTYMYQGRRLMLTGPGGKYLMLESKGAGPQFPQTTNPVIFPTDKWVHLEIYMFLSPYADGRTGVWQDGVKILDWSGQNMPPGTFYDWMEVGITANSSRYSQTVYVDDVVISDKGKIPNVPSQLRVAP